jgi:translation initiation factor IF-3
MVKLKTKKTNSSQPLINQQISSSQILLLTAEAKEIISKQEALKKAQQMGLDLVCISPNNSPPVCKILDYQKYLFELKKKQKIQKKTSHKNITKEIKISFHISEGDLATKSKQILKWLEEGYSVKVNLKMFGVEPEHQELVLAKGQRIITDLQTREKKVRLQRAIKLQGKICSFILQKSK